MEYIDPNTAPYYGECASIVNSLGLALVELSVNRRKKGWQARAVAFNPDGRTSVEDCARVHRLLQLRLQALLGSDDLYMEVTSPGLDRNIKSPFEFALFARKGVRVFSAVAGEWISGVILSADSRQVTLEKSGGAQINVPYGEITKAKLDYSQEA